jgi:uncharacterized surface protein with fasciclin (FAS1) repeats
MDTNLNRRRFLSRSAGLAVAAPFVSLAAPALAVTGDATIVELAAATPDLSTLVTAVQAAGLVDTLSSDGNFTVFAPTNRAFEHLPAGALDGLLADTAALTDVLTYHVSPDYYPASALAGAHGVLPTVQGDHIRVDGRNGVVLNGTTRVTTADVFASNGVVHIIDAVLMPH